jgi:pimeloyl-ACP methyl ester carboxylesterase
MEIFNLFHGTTDVGPSGDEPPGYELTRAARVGKAIGANAEVVTVEKAGHSIHLERPAELAELLTSWLTSA